MVESTVVAALSGVIVGLTLRSSRWRQFIDRLRNYKSAASVKESVKVVIVVRPDLGMTQGKVAAQCAHAAVACFSSAQIVSPVLLQAWLAMGQPKIVLRCNQPGERGLQDIMKESKRLGIITEGIHDAGHTQVAQGTLTVIGIGPSPVSLVDKVTGHLKVY